MNLAIKFFVPLALAVFSFTPMPSRAQAPAATAAAPLSAGAERIFAQARPKLLQIRTLTKAARSQSSIGSGFLVASNLAVTNYHVVSQKVMEADRYDLQWQNIDNQQGALQVVAVDVANDLALVRVSPAAGGTAPGADALFGFAAQEPARGERVYSMGRPLDIGFNVIEGTHNGRVESDFNRRLLFSGAINSGMSGGPAVNANGEVYGINVAKNRSGELVSYVVPAEFAKALFTRYSNQSQMDTANKVLPQTLDFLPVMTEQLKQHQDRLQQALFAKPLFTRMLGRYQVPAEVPPLLKCWANTTKNDNKLRHVEDQVQCRVDAGIFIDERLYTGTVQMQHLLVTSNELNRLQFQSLINQRYRPAQLGMIRQHLTADRCSEDFITHNGIQWRATVCAQAMKKFPGLYDFGVSAISLDANTLTDKGMRQALFTAMHVDGVTWEAGIQSVKRYLDALGVAGGVAK